MKQKKKVFILLKKVAHKIIVKAELGQEVECCWYMRVGTNKCEFYSIAARMNQPWLLSVLEDEVIGLVEVRVARALSLHAMGEEQFLGKSRSTVTKKKKRGGGINDGN